MGLTLSQIRELIAHIPALGGFQPHEIGVRRLGGISNANFRLDTPRGGFVLRLPGSNPSDDIDRANEIQAARLAEIIGIGAEIIYADVGSGMILTRLIADSVTLTADHLRRSPPAVRAAGKTLARLHTSGGEFAKRLDVFDVMARYERELGSDEAGDQAFSPALRAVILETRDYLKQTATVPAPCHGDASPDNFLVSGDRMFLIDWEYAAMVDPAWDLAYLSFEGGFDAEQDAALIRAYNHPAIAMDRLQIYKLPVAVLAVLWGRLRTHRGLSPDLAAWTGDRLELAEDLAANSVARALRRARGGSP